MCKNNGVKKIYLCDEEEWYCFWDRVCRNWKNIFSCSNGCEGFKIRICKENYFNKICCRSWRKFRFFIRGFEREGRFIFMFVIWCFIWYFWIRIYVVYDGVRSNWNSFVCLYEGVYVWWFICYFRWGLKYNGCLNKNVFNKIRF